MVETDRGELLALSAREVLETMFFAEVLGDAEALPDGPAPFGARLSFRGEPSGTFSLAVTREVARTIAANFLGIEAEDAISDMAIGEVICELANMICGAVLSRLEADAKFELSSPEMAVSPRFSRAFDLGGGVLAVNLELQAPQ